MSMLKKSNTNEELLKAIDSLGINMTMEEFGSKLNYQKATVSKYLSGKLPPSNDFLKKFKEVFNVDLKDFEDELDLPQISIIQRYDNVSRFNELLKRIKFDRPVTEITEGTGFSKGSVSDILNGKREPSKKFVDKFEEVFFNVKNPSTITEPSIPPFKSEDYSIQDYIKTLHQLLELKDELAVKEKRIIFLESEIMRLTKIGKDDI